MKRLVIVLLVLIMVSSVWAGLDAGNGKIINVATPTEPNDGANKQYVDDVAAAPGHNLLSIAHGDTTTQTVSRGSIIYGNSTPAWDELALGTSGYILKSDGTDIAWINPYVLSHNSFADYVANEHIDWTNATENLKTSGYLGLGSGVGQAAMPINVNYSIDAANLNFLNLYGYDTRASTGGIIRGLYFSANWKPADALTANRKFIGLYGFFGNATLDTSNLTSGWNVTVDNAAGGYVAVNVLKGGSHTGAATITNARGLWIANAGLTGGGVITTQQGLYIAPMTSGATNYAIYSEGGQSVHAGNLRIGSTTAPAIALDVTGSADISGNLDVNDVTVNGLATSSATLTFGGGGSGDCNSITITNGLITGYTTIP